MGRAISGPLGTQHSSKARDVRARVQGRTKRDDRRVLRRTPGPGVGAGRSQAGAVAARTRTDRCTRDRRSGRARSAGCRQPPRLRSGAAQRRGARLLGQHRRRGVRRGIPAVSPPRSAHGATRLRGTGRHGDVPSAAWRHRRRATATPELPNRQPAPNHAGHIGHDWRVTATSCAPYLPRTWMRTSVDLELAFRDGVMQLEDIGEQAIDKRGSLLVATAQRLPTLLSTFLTRLCRADASPISA